MNEIDMLYTQQLHIDNLQKKLNERKNVLKNRLFNTKDWIYFLLKRTNSYYRPRNGQADILAHNCEWHGRIDIDYDEQDHSKISIKLFESGVGSYRLKTIYFPSDELLDFIKDTDSDNHHGNYWWSTTPS